MGALIVIAAFVLPLLPYLPKPSRVTHLLAYWVTDFFGESGAVLVYLAAWWAAMLGVFWAGRLANVGPEVAVAFAIAVVGVVLIRLLKGENIDFD